MKLSVQTDPGVRGLFVESDWSSAPENVFTGTLALTFGRRERQDRGEVVGRDPWRTRNLHDVDCEHSPVQLRRKVSDGPEHCVGQRPNRLSVGKPAATCTGVAVAGRGRQEVVAVGWWRAAGERAASRWKVADGTTLTSRRINTKLSSSTKQIRPSQFCFSSKANSSSRFPAVATGAILNYRLAEGGGSITPGSPISADEHLVLVDTSSTPEMIYYTYLVK